MVTDHNTETIRGVWGMSYPQVSLSDAMTRLANIDSVGKYIIKFSIPPYYRMNHYIYTNNSRLWQLAVILQSDSG